MQSSDELKRARRKGVHLFNFKFSVDIMNGYWKWSKELVLANWNVAH